MPATAMFSKFKHGAGAQNVLDNNPILQFFEVGKLTASAGPEFVWKIHDAYRKSDGKEVSVFLFEKRIAEKLHKPKRKETITEILRASVRQLERFRHPKILQVLHSVEECSETLAFASEPVLASLANILAFQEERPQGGPPPHAREYHFLDMELKYGLLQITEALTFLHYSGHVLHRNVCPASILVTKKGTWKLGGLEFTERVNDIDGLEPVPCQPWTSRLAKMAQPDLDYIAPEVQSSSICSILSDMFSLGMVICTIFNQGRPLIQANHSSSTYMKQLEVLEDQLHNVLPRVPLPLQEAAVRLLSRDTRQRPTAQLLSLIKYFSDSSVHALQFLDVINMKDPTQKAHFYRNTLKEVLPYIPRKLWYQHVWPCLQQEMKAQEVLAAVLQPIIYLVQESSAEEYEKLILPAFRSVFSTPKSIQATVTLLENLHIVLEKTPRDDIRAEVLPMLYNAFESTTLQVQSAALVAVTNVAEYLDEAAIRRMVLPKTKLVYEKNSGDLKIVLNVLLCLERTLDRLDRSMIIDEVLPLLWDVRLSDPEITLRVVNIYRLMLSDKKFGLSVNLMATRVMPSLLPQTVNPSLNLEQFTSLLEVLQEMLDHIDRNQRNKLKLDNLSLPSPERHRPLRHQYSSDNMHAGAPFNIPNLRIEQRKTSSAEDMARKNSAGASSLHGMLGGWWFGGSPSSPDSNFLRVHNAFPNRRLSDNQLMMPPKIRIAPSCASSPGGTPGGSGGLPIRRHSSIGPQERRGSTINLSPPTASSYHSMVSRDGSSLSVPATYGGSMPNTSSSVPFLLSSSMSSIKSGGSRRPSACLGLSGGSPGSAGLLQQLGSGMVQGGGDGGSRHVTAGREASKRQRRGNLAMSSAGGGGPSTATAGCTSSSTSLCCGHVSRAHVSRRVPPPALLCTEHEVGAPDALLLEPLTEDAFVANLQQRFKRDTIYTGAGDVLVSVNPYKKLALYSLDVVEAYRRSSLLVQLPPHIFALADSAHRLLRERNEDQCVVVSGESGSGKTEAARIVLQYVTVATSGPHVPGLGPAPPLPPVSDMPPSAAPPIGGCRAVRDRLLQAGPLLEAFGNAKTYRNDNSSRFGKYLDVEFDFKGDPLGGSVTSYLLEKSRVTRQAPGERNFHIFYQLLTGADIHLLKSLKLHRNIDNYSFLRPSRPLSMETIDDRRDFQVTKKALETLGFGSEDVVQVFKVVASVLKLGNIGFSPASNIDGTEGCTLTNDYEMFEVCALLGTDAAELTSALTQRTILTGPSVLDSPANPSGGCSSRGGGKSGGCPASSTAGTPPAFVPSASRPSLSSSQSREVYEVCELLQHGTAALHSALAARLAMSDERGGSGGRGGGAGAGGELVVADLSAAEATAARDTLCRALYSRLFAWLVKQVNEATRVRRYGKRKVLGILDIYGFEVLEHNGFEQFIINFCNEKLQQAVTEVTLRMRQEEYVREGLEWTPVDFFNNTPICELIEKNTYGILSMLDEESQRGACAGVSPDEAFLSRLAQTCSGNTHFETRGCSPRSIVSTSPSETACTNNVPPNCFRLRHYAGTVTYCVAGFVEKNCDSLPRDLSLAMFRCDHPLLKSLFPEGNPKRTTLKRPATAGTQFKISVGALMRNLQSKTPHFVRCIKPNELKQPRIFELALVQHQVRYLGLVQTVRVRKLGFAHRECYESFLHRYKMLSPHTWPSWRGSAVEGVSYLLRDLPLSSPHFAFGRTKLFIRSNRTLLELEEFRRQRLEDLAASVQKLWRGWRCRRRYHLMRHSQIVIASAWRSWRAREEYRELKRRKQIEWAVTIIQRHYVHWKRRQFLVRLCCNLPSESPVSRDWPLSPRRLAETSLLLRRIHHKWRCHRYRLRFDQTARNRMREKVTASIIFKDRKASYARSVSHPFLGDYVRLRQNVQWKKICVETNDQYVVFADIINKITRSSGKFVPILFVLSTSSMLILDQRTLQVKYRVPAAEIYRLSLSPFLDDVAIFHVRAGCGTGSDTIAGEGCVDCRGGGSSPGSGSAPCKQHTATGCLFQSDLGKKKGDFVFQTGHVIEIVTKLFLVIQNAVGKPPEVNISTEFEANFGAQTVLFQFKCMGLPEVQPGQIKILRKGSRMEVLV